MTAAAQAANPLECAFEITIVAPWRDPKSVKAFIVGIDGDNDERRTARGVTVEFLHFADPGLAVRKARIDLGAETFFKARVRLLTGTDARVRIADDELDRLRQAVRDAGYHVEVTP